MVVEVGEYKVQFHPKHTSVMAVRKYINSEDRLKVWEYCTFSLAVFSNFSKKLEGLRNDR